MGSGLHKLGSNVSYTRTGIVLAARNYQACVDFYTKKIGLPVMFALDNEHSTLTCCDMGGGVYLMIERSDSSIAEEKSRTSIWLRFNVADVDAVSRELEEKGLKAHVRREAWGTVADFFDPDGNRCSLRDEGSFGPPEGN